MHVGRAPDLVHDIGSDGYEAGQIEYRPPGFDHVLLFVEDVERHQGTQEAGRHVDGLGEGQHGTYIILMFR